MSTSTHQLPEGWARAEDTDEQVGQYNAQKPIRYRREGIEGRDGAIGTAREFMETDNDRHIEGDESEADVISSF